MSDAIGDKGAHLHVSQANMRGQRVWRVWGRKKGSAFLYRTFIWGLCVEYRSVPLEKCAHWLDITYENISIWQGT